MDLRNIKEGSSSSHSSVRSNMEIGGRIGAREPFGAAAGPSGGRPRMDKGLEMFINAQAQDTIAFWDRGGSSQL